MEIKPPSLWSRIRSALFGTPIFYNTGVVPDPRPQAELDKDYAHEERELAQADALDPFRFSPIEIAMFTDDDQQGASSCVPHGVGFALARERAKTAGKYVRLAWTYAYRLRANFPDAGSWLQDIFEIYRKNGAPLYSSLPDPATEAQANAVVITAAMRQEAEIFKGLEYYLFNTPNSIDAVAKVAATGTDVPILFYSTYQEWSRAIVKILTFGLLSISAEVRHCVCVLANSGHRRGSVKYVTIKDSAWFGGFGLRHVPEDFFTKRVYGAGYWTKVNFLSQPGTPPRYSFKIPLNVGASGPDVKKMQELFIALQLLPTDCATGYFGGRTLAALHAFQTMFADEILTPNGLTKATDNWGPSSRKKANALCNA